MKKYKIDYMDGDGEIITVTIEASYTAESINLVIFCDEDSEGDYVFYKKDIISYCTI